MERLVLVVLVQPEKRTFVTGVQVNDSERLVVLVSRVADKLKTAAGVTALESQLEFSRISEADARAFRVNSAHVAERTCEFDEFASVRDAFVDGCDCVLVKLIGEWAVPRRLGRPLLTPSLASDLTSRRRPGGRGGGGGGGR